MTTEVTAHNQVRAESDLQMKLWIKGSDLLGDVGSVGFVSVGVRHDAPARRPDR